MNGIANVQYRQTDVFDFLAGMERCYSASPAPRKPAPLSDSELSDLIDAVKKAVSTVGAGVTVPRNGAANIKP